MILFRIVMFFNIKNTENIVIGLMLMLLSTLYYGQLESGNYVKQKQAGFLFKGKDKLKPDDQMNFWHCTTGWKYSWAKSIVEEMV